jgi:iron complex transport system permease protein
LVGVLVLFVILSIPIGRYQIGLKTLFRALFAFATGDGEPVAPTVKTILFTIRIPRILSAAAVGLSLSVAGAAYQGLFRNPMVSPDILGATAGAGFGAALGILLSLPSPLIQLVSFVFGLAAVGLTWSIGKAVSGGSGSALSLVLSGIVVSTLFTAFVSLVKYLADPFSKLPAITFWLMGGLASAGASELAAAAPPMLIGLVPLVLLRWKLNVMTFGDEEARAMGIDVVKVRLAVVFSSTLMTSAAVSVCGSVGWVGLMIPHLARFLVGPDFRVLVPASALMGAAFTVVVDDAARCVSATEVPLGILTAVIGAPFFLLLLARERGSWT